MSLLFRLRPIHDPFLFLDVHQLVSLPHLRLTTARRTVHGVARFALTSSRRPNRGLDCRWDPRQNRHRGPHMPHPTAAALLLALRRRLAVRCALALRPFFNPGDVLLEKLRHLLIHSGPPVRLYTQVCWAPPRGIWWWDSSGCGFLGEM